MSKRNRHPLLHQICADGEAEHFLELLAKLREAFQPDSAPLDRLVFDFAVLEWHTRKLVDRTDRNEWSGTPGGPQEQN